MIKQVLMCLLLLLPLTGFSQPEVSSHPIDLQLEECHSIDSNQTTMGMIECERIAIEAWDKELNRVYQLLMNKLSSDDQARLRASQRKWIEFRDHEITFSDYMFSGMDGTMWLVAAAGKRTRIVRQRVLELLDYYDTAQMGH